MNTDDFIDEKVLEDLIEKIEFNSNPKLDDGEWMLVTEALEYYKQESFKD